MKFIRIASPDTEFKRGNNKIIVEIDGNEIKDIPAFYELLVYKLSFPGYFGENLDALYDMLLDLQWIKHEAIELVITNFNNFLSDETNEDKADLMLLLEQVCQGWRDGDFDDEEWEMKKFRVYVVGEANVGDEVSQLIASIQEEEGN